MASLDYVSKPSCLCWKVKNIECCSHQKFLWGSWKNTSLEIVLACISADSPCFAAAINMIVQNAQKFRAQLHICSLVLQGAKSSQQSKWIEADQHLAGGDKDLAAPGSKWVTARCLPWYESRTVTSLLVAKWMAEHEANKCFMLKLESPYILKMLSSKAVQYQHTIQGHYSLRERHAVTKPKFLVCPKLLYFAVMKKWLARSWNEWQMSVEGIKGNVTLLRVK